LATVVTIPRGVALKVRVIEISGNLQGSAHARRRRPELTENLKKNNTPPDAFNFNPSQNAIIGLQMS
jgi:hypothetical protein